MAWKKQITSLDVMSINENSPVLLKQTDTGNTPQKPNICRYPVSAIGKRGEDGGGEDTLS